MKKVFLKSMLLLCALIVGSGSVWGSTKSEGFETKATSTTYNSTVTISAAESDDGIAWSIYYGTVSTNDKISGSNSAQMRFYTGMSGLPYIKTTSPIDGLSNVSFKARVSDVKIKMDVSYSADGSSWTVHPTQGSALTFAAASTAYDFSVDIPSGNYYVKIGVSSSSSGQANKSKLIIDDVVLTYSSSKVDATWSISPASATVMEGNNTTLQLTTNYDGTLSFVSGDDDVATVSYNSSTKVITVTGVAAGSTTITATGDATATYNPIAKYIAVTVNHTEKPSNVTDVIGPWGYSFFSLTPSGSDTYVNYDGASISKTDAYGVGYTFNKNSGTALRFDGNYMRLYNKNSFVINAPTGSYITKIVFVEPATSKSWDGSFTVTPTGGTGEYVSGEKTWYASSTGVTSLTFTNDATKRIAGIDVYFQVASSLQITPAYDKSTCVAPGNLDFSNISGLKAYRVSEAASGTVTTNEVGQVPAGTPLLLIGTAGTTYSVPVIASASSVGTNLLLAGDGSTAFKGTTYDYLLYSDGLFYKIGSGVVARNKAYLHCTSDPNPGESEAPGLRIVVEENNATNIEAVDAGEKVVKFFENGQIYIKRDNVVYDALGRVIR